MVEQPESSQQAMGKKSRKRAKRPGAKRSPKMKREAKKKGKDGEAEPAKDGKLVAEGPEDKDAKREARKKRKEKEAEERELDNRVWVGGLPLENDDEQVLMDHFGECGTITNLKLNRNTRLVFRGSCFISYKKATGVQAALQLDDTEFKGKKISVKKAAAPVEPPDLKVYVGGLPWKATEEVLRKDFGECGEIGKFHMLKDPATGKSRGAMFVTYKTQAGVDAAMKFHDTDYGGRYLTVRLASTKPPETDAPNVGKRKREEATAEAGEEGDAAVVAAEEGEADAASRETKVQRKSQKQRAKEKSKAAEE